MGIPSGAKFTLRDETTVVGTASTDDDIDKVMIDEDNERRIRVAVKLTPKGQPTSTIIARFKPTGLGAKIRRATIDGLWESRYISEAGLVGLVSGIPRIETIELKTGRTVAEVKNVKILGDGLFSAEEVCYEGSTVVYDSIVVRHAGTGLLVKESVQKGQLPRDYHHYELVLIGWPDGSR